MIVITRLVGSSHRAKSAGRRMDDMFCGKDKLSEIFP